MPLVMTQGLPFDRTTISQHVPIASGVYGLYQSTLLIYVGESNDLRHRLAEHLTEVGTCIEQCGASTSCTSSSTPGPGSLGSAP